MAHDRIGVLVQHGLRSALSACLDRLTDDLRNEGTRTWILELGSDISPPWIRQTLRAQYEGEGLSGVLLVGRIPSLLFNKDGEGTEYWHDHPCDGFYMDLYGVFADPNTRGALTRWEPDLSVDGGIQIWASRIRADTLRGSGMGSEVELYQRYFRKNHAYRNGKLALPPRRARVFWFTIDVLRSDWGTRVHELYGKENVVATGHLTHGRRELADRYRRILRDPEGYECMVLNCRTFAQYHQFDRRGKHRITWQDVRDTAPKRFLWFHMLTSEPGRHDEENYLAGIYLFGENPTMAIFTSNQHGGALGKELYPGLIDGKSFGEAQKEALRYVARHDGEPTVNYACWNAEPEDWPQTPENRSAGVLHGDGTLGLPSRYYRGRG